MKILGIKIENFLSFDSFEWKNVHTDLNMIIGPNGSGKTNIFNALRMICDALAFNPNLGEMKSFAHDGNTSKPIHLEFDIQFNQQEQNIIKEFLGACFISQIADQVSLIDSKKDEALVNWLKDSDIEKFYKGTLTAQYDFVYRNWRINYIQPQFELCSLSGDLQNIIAGKNVEDLWKKFKATLKTKIAFDNLTLGAQIEGKQIPKFNVGDKSVTGLNCRIDTNREYKSIQPFYELIGSSVKSYWLSKLFEWLFKKAIVFSENVRPFPENEFSAKEMESDLSESITNENIALFLFKLKNGNFDQREKFKKIQKNFNKLTENLEFEVISSYKTKEISFIGNHPIEAETTSPNQAKNLKYDLTSIIKIFIVRNGLEIPMEYSGAGIWETLYFSSLAESNGNIYLLDEPAANVHPIRQRLFMELFRNLINFDSKKESQADTQKNQIFLITHSPYLVDLKALENTFRFCLENGATRRKHYPIGISLSQGQTVNNEPRKNHKEIEFLGRKIENIFPLFSKGVLLVEGPTEYIVLPELFRKWAGCSLEEKNITAVYVEGKGNFGKYLKLYQNFEIPWAILCDGDAVGSIEYHANECEINEHLKQIGENINFEDLNQIDYQKRKEELEKKNVFTTAVNEKENFDSFVNELLGLFIKDPKKHLKIENASLLAEKIFEMNEFNEATSLHNNSDEIIKVLKEKFFNPIFEKIEFLKILINLEK